MCCLCLWKKKANIRCCVDGGTNRWRQFLKSFNESEMPLRPPEFITGDFDSISEESRTYFCNDVTKFIHTPDQNATDFTKALDLVRPLLLAQNVSFSPLFDFDLNKKTFTVPRYNCIPRYFWTVWSNYGEYQYAIQKAKYYAQSLFVKWQFFNLAVETWQTFH